MQFENSEKSKPNQAKQWLEIVRVLVEVISKLKDLFAQRSLRL